MVVSSRISDTNCNAEKNSIIYLYQPRITSLPLLLKELIRFYSKSKGSYNVLKLLKNNNVCFERSVHFIKHLLNILK